MKVMLDEAQSRSLHRSVDSRIRELESARTYNLKHALPVGAIERELEILQGDDDTAGVKSLIGEQITMFETGKFDELELGLSGEESGE
jgi:hypothetical protein